MRFLFSPDSHQHTNYTYSIYGFPAVQLMHVARPRPALQLSERISIRAAIRNMDYITITLVMHMRKCTARNVTGCTGARATEQCMQCEAPPPPPLSPAGIG